VRSNYESHILRDAILGDPEALSVLIDKYKDIAFNLAISIVKNREDARDITQDGFLKVLENIHKFRNESKFSTWLYKIVYNLSIGYVQKKGGVEIMDITDNLQPPNMPGNEYKIDKYKELHQAIDDLEDSEKNLIHLFYLGEKSLKEIHQITGLSVSNIKVTLYRARIKLSEKLKNEKAE